jgi:hypothetical protein
MTITASVQLKNKIRGLESLGACLQDELSGGNPPDSVRSEVLQTPAHYILIAIHLP